MICLINDDIAIIFYIPASSLTSSLTLLVLGFLGLLKTGGRIQPPSITLEPLIVTS